MFTAVRLRAGACPGACEARRPVAGSPNAPTTDPVPTDKTDPKNSKKTDDSTEKGDRYQGRFETAKTDSLPSPGEALDPHIKKGSEDDVDAVGTRNIGGRGMGNWYSTDWEIRNGKQYSMEIEKQSHLVTDPVVVEYVNRIGQNIVKNSDCKVSVHDQGAGRRRNQCDGAAGRLLSMSTPA